MILLLVWLYDDCLIIAFDFKSLLFFISFYHFSHFCCLFTFTLVVSHFVFTVIDSLLLLLFSLNLFLSFFTYRLKALYIPSCSSCVMSAFVSSSCRKTFSIIFLHLPLLKLVQVNSGKPKFQHKEPIVELFLILKIPLKSNGLWHFPVRDRKHRLLVIW